MDMQLDIEIEDYIWLCQNGRQDLADRLEQLVKHNRLQRERIERQELDKDIYKRTMDYLDRQNKELLATDTHAEVKRLRQELERHKWQDFSGIEGALEFIRQKYNALLDEYEYD